MWFFVKSYFQVCSWHLDLHVSHLPELFNLNCQRFAIAPRQDILPLCIHLCEIFVWQPEMPFHFRIQGSVGKTSSFKFGFNMGGIEWISLRAWKRHFRHRSTSICRLELERFFLEVLKPQFNLSLSLKTSKNPQFKRKNLLAWKTSLCVTFLPNQMKKLPTFSQKAVLLEGCGLEG